MTGMAERANAQSDIPQAPFYVTAVDSFMSGWGEAQGRVNLVCLPCENEAEVKAVLAYVRTRPEMERVKVSHTAPLVDAETEVSVYSVEAQPVWYGLVVRQEVEEPSI
jgi:hypothetical protein